MTVFLGKSSHSESIRPPFEKWKILNISPHPKFFSSFFLKKKRIFDDSVSRQIKSFWVEWTPLWKMKNFVHFSSPKIFSSFFFEKKNVFLMTVFLGKSSHSESNGPPLKNEKFWIFLITQIFSQVFLKKPVFFLTVFLGKLSHSKSIKPPFRKWKILNIFITHNFFTFLFKKDVFHCSVTLGKSGFFGMIGSPMTPLSLFLLIHLLKESCTITTNLHVGKFISVWTHKKGVGIWSVAFLKFICILLILWTLDS